MKISYTLYLGGLAILSLLWIILPALNNQLRSSDTFTVNYESISGLLRTNFTVFDNFNNIFALGDLVGSVSIWQYDSKKNQMIFKSISRIISPQLSTQNPVIQLLMPTAETIITLTLNSQLKAYSIGSDFSFETELTFNTTQKIQKFMIIDSKNFAIITNFYHSWCIYSISGSWSNPGQLKQIYRNNTNNTFLDFSYSKSNNLISLGNNKSVISFTFINSTVNYVSQVFQPKSAQSTFTSQFTQFNSLIISNGQWLSSLLINLTDSIPIKIISSVKLSRLLQKGQCDKISVFNIEKDKSSVALINGPNLVLIYEITDKKKLNEKIQSKTKDKLTSFILYGENIFFSLDGILLNQFKISYSFPQQDPYINLDHSYPLQSSNHFNKVNVVSIYKQLLISLSEGGENNIKIWNISDKQIKLSDQKTLQYISLLKLNQLSLKTILLLPQNTTSNKNQILHFIVAGSQPFNLNLLILGNNNKIISIFKTTDQHDDNITCLFRNNDIVISGSMDTLLYTWKLSNDEKELNKSSQVIPSRNGPIKFGIISPDNKYFVLGHCGTVNNSQINLTLWTIANNKIIKITQNVPGEAHQSNLTALLFTFDYKYIISYSQSGQLRLWRHQNWTIIDLLASLSLGNPNFTLKITAQNLLLAESQDTFYQFLIDQNGFILANKASKSFKSQPSSLNIVENKIFSGDKDGAIRIYNYTL